MSGLGAAMERVLAVAVGVGLLIVCVDRNVLLLINIFYCDIMESSWVVEKCFKRCIVALHEGRLLERERRCILECREKAWVILSVLKEGGVGRK